MFDYYGCNFYMGYYNCKYLFDKSEHKRIKERLPAFPSGKIKRTARKVRHELIIKWYTSGFL